jgi:hypothetical protein
MLLLTKRVSRKLGHSELTIVDETLFWGSCPLQWKSSSPTAGIAIRMGSIANYWQFCNSSDGSLSRKLHQDRPMRTQGTHTQPGYVKQDFHSNTKPFRFPYTFRFTSDSSRFTINDLVLSETSQPDSLPFRGPAATALYGKSCHTYWRIMEDLQQ